MLQLLTASLFLLVPMGPSQPHDRLQRRALRRATPVPGCCASNAAEQAQSGFFRKQKAAKGVEAFSNTLWSVLMNVKDSGNVLFTVHLLDDFRCRFSDGDKYGEWQCEEDYVVMEKPQGLYNETLYLSELRHPTQLHHPTPRPELSLTTLAHVARQVRSCSFRLRSSRGRGSSTAWCRGRSPSRAGRTRWS